VTEGVSETPAVVAAPTGARPAIAPEEALEPALRALVEQSGAVAGAICLFDPGEKALRLAAEIGLSDEGCRVLRTVRADSPVWHAPLSSLLDRRVCVLEPGDPATLPSLVDAADSLAVACMPVYQDDQPRVSVILVGAVTEETIRNLTPALARIGRVVEAIPRRAASTDRRQAGRASVLDVIAGMALGGIGPVVREVRQVLQATGHLAVSGLAGAVRMVDPFADSATRAAERLQQLEGTVQALRAARRDLELSMLEREAKAEARCQSARACADTASARAEVLEGERGRLMVGLQEAVGREQQVREELAGLIARGAAEREEVLGRAREATEGAEAARAAAVAEAEALAAVLAEARAARLAAENEARGARNEVERLATVAATAEAERTRLRTEVEEARQREEAVQARLAELEGAQGRLVREVEEAAWRVRRSEEELTGVIARSAAEREETLGHALEATQAAEAARVAAVARAEELAAALATTRAAALAAEDEAQRAQAEVARLAAGERAALAERQQLESVVEEARRREAAARTEIDRLEAQLRAEREQKVQEASPTAPADVPPESMPAARPPTRSPSRAEPVVAVLDLDSTWETAAGDTRVIVLSPGVNLGQRLADIDPTLVLANLAREGVLEALAVLRDQGCFAPFEGFLGAPGAERAIALGPVDLATRPVSADALLAAMAFYAGRSTRVLLAGADSDAFLSVRHALVREGMLVSIAWDAKQADDLLPMVRPEVAIVDLGLPPRGGYGTVAGLATLDPLPTTIVVPSGNDAAGFMAALAGSGRAAQMLPLAQLLANALRRNHGDRPHGPGSAMASGGLKR
jgi:hypothetical protein